MPVIVSGSYDPLANLIPDPNVSYARLAEAHYLAAEAGALDLARLAEELVTLREREAKGEKWMQETEESGIAGAERANAGYMLLMSIRDDIHTVEQEMAMTERATWEAVKGAYVAEYMRRKAVGCPTNAQNRSGRTIDPEMSHTTSRAHASPRSFYDVDYPIFVWHALVGDREPPGAWPPAPGEEERPLTGWVVDEWEVEELQQLVNRKKR